MSKKKMSKGSVTKKQSERHETRSTQRQQRNKTLQREQERKKRNRRIIYFGLILCGGALFAVLLAFVIHNASSSSTGPKTIDGISCNTNEGAVTHIHTALKLYVNGTQSQIPVNIGINTASSCLYALHTHSTNNIIHVEAPDQKTYALGQFFDIWGQPLSRTQVADNQSDGTNSLIFEIFDAKGTRTTYTGDPRSLPLADQETVVILYNSPDVHPIPFTDWQGI